MVNAVAHVSPLQRRQAAIATREDHWHHEAVGFLQRNAHQRSQPLTANDLEFQSTDAPILSGALSRRLQSVQFLAWQQEQLADDLSRRTAATSAIQTELSALQDALRAEETNTASASEGIWADEARIVEAHEHTAHQVFARWRDLEEREATVTASAHAAREAAEAYEQHRACLVDVEKLLMSADQRAAQVHFEAGLLADCQQEVDSREASLQCMEGALACIVQQAGGAAFDSSKGDGLLEAIQEGVSERVLEEFLSTEPRLRRQLRCVWAAVQSSVGGTPLSARFPAACDSVETPLLAATRDGIGELPQEPVGDGAMLPSESQFVGFARSCAGSSPSSSPKRAAAGELEGISTDNRGAEYQRARSLPPPSRSIKEESSLRDATPQSPEGNRVARRYPSPHIAHAVPLQVSTPQRPLPLFTTHQAQRTTGVRGMVVLPTISSSHHAPLGTAVLGPTPGATAMSHQNLGWRLCPAPATQPTLRPQGTRALGLPTVQPHVVYLQPLV